GSGRGHEQDAHPLLEPIELAFLRHQPLEPRPDLRGQPVGLFHREQLDAHAVLPGAQCVSNDLPQPHERTAFGLRIANPVACSVSTQSTSTPCKAGALCGSTNTFTPPNSPTQSPGCSDSANDMPYW